MLLVGFVISFSRILGGYFAAANIGMLLAFVIAVTIPAPADAIPARLGGWALAGLLSTVSAVALWPRFERVTTHHKAAKALLARQHTSAGTFPSRSMTSSWKDGDLSCDQLPPKAPADMSAGAEVIRSRRAHTGPRRTTINQYTDWNATDRPERRNDYERQV